MLNNQSIRAAAKNRGVKLYEVAERLGVSQATITRKLYFELPEDEQQRLLSIIDEIAAQKENAAQSAANALNG